MARRRSGSGARNPRRRQVPAVSTRALQPQGGTGTGRADVTAATSEAVEPEALVVTHWFDSGEEGEPFDATVRFTGRREGVRGLPRAGDSFSQDETIKGVLPGTGPVSITAWVYGLQRGEWTVDARLVRGFGSGHGAIRSGPGGNQPIEPATWSWRRWGLSTVPSRPVKTRWALLAPLARQPAVVPGVYTALAVVGFVLALALQAAILTGRGVPIGPPISASLIAIVAGLGGAKAWYAVLHPDESLIKGGWAVDGFVVVFPPVGALVLFGWDQPIGMVLDASAPGVFFAVAIGRIGCFFTGCCAGRCTASRWGIWSSDRRVGARRVPAQLLESATGLTIGLASLALVAVGGLPIPGAIFLTAFVAYAVARQALLRLRAERRKDQRTLPITAAAAGVVVVAVAALTLLQSS